MTIDGAGNFTLTQTVSRGGTISRQSAIGTYAVGVDCSLNLNFSSAPGATTGGFQAPTAFRGLVVDASTGLIVVQPNSTEALSGALLVQ